MNTRRTKQRPGSTPVQPPLAATGQAGMTLLEILIALAIGSFVLIAAGFFGLDIADFGFLISESLGVQQELSLTLKNFSREARGIGPADHGGYPIAAASSTSFTFYSDLDGNNKFEQVRYYIEGATLKKGVIRSTGTPPVYQPADEIISEITHNLTSGNIFKFYDQNFSGSEPPLAIPVNVPAIRLVKMTLTADTNPLEPPGPITQTLFTNMRNTRTNPQ